MRYCLILGILFCGSVHAQEPRCSPGQYSPTVNWQVGVASDASIVSILWCSDSVGLDWWATGWDPARTPVNSCAGNVRSESATTLLAAFWTNCLSGTAALTTAQQTEVDRLLQMWMPKLETPREEAVYRYANGALVDHEGSLAAHSPCSSQVVATHDGVDFYDVSGLAFTDGSVIPAHSAAQCQVVPPPATGWPK
jgi:hypothetical protein